MHNFGEEQDGAFLNVFRDGVPSYFTCLVSDGAVFLVLQISCNVCIPLRGQCSIGQSRHRADEYGEFLINFTLLYHMATFSLIWDDCVQFC